ncbi:MAG TPA: hypothetical protein VF962_12875 [Gemmatimonadaceae bacterium]
MNPPFGKPSIGGKEYIDQRYDRGKSDIYAAFVERGVELAAHGGSIGALTSRLGLFSAFLEGWRSEFMFGDGSLVVLADLGHGVLDDALVEAAAYVLEKGTGSEVFWGRGLLESRDKSTDLLRMTRASGSDGLSWRNRARLRSLPGSPIAYWVPDSFIAATFAHPPLAESVGEARWGLQADDNFRFVRLAWEVVPDGKSWFPLAKGGEYALFYDDIHLAVRWSDSARELRAFIEAKYSWTKRASSAELYGRPGLTYPERTTSELSLRALPAGCIFNIAGPAIVIEDCTLRLSLLALSYTRVFRTLVEVLIGGGDAVESGSAARHYKAGALNRVPVPLLANAEGRKLAQAGKTSLDIALELAQQDETGRLFAGLSLRKSFDDFLTTTIFQYEDALITLEQQSQEADDLAMDSYGLDNESRRFVDQAYGPHSSRGQAVPRQERVARLLDLSEDALVDELAPQLGYRRQTTKQAYFTDRKYELVALAENASVASVVRSRRALGFASNEQRDRWAHAVLSWLFGVGIGRWHGRPRRWTGDPFEALPLAPPALRDEVGRVRDVVVDDPGTASDIEAVISAACAEVGWESTQVVAVATVAAGTDTRGYFANEFFGQHITRYSRSRRKAPIYWQLATPSARYSVWLYLNALTKDTLYKVQSEYVAPKLAHEERRLESLRLELGERPKSSDRRALASQESFVDELHAFLDEVKRVAPLWKPNPDDGVIINFAPLWRLVPQHRQWQQELKATWDALCDGEHDWVHLAMHLWPERVLPKCATDRSLAIAHGVEQIFWVESTEGKWTSRKSPTRSIEELVRERASPAVKAALKSLLEAPVATGSRGRGRGGRRLPDVPAEEGAP